MGIEATQRAWASNATGTDLLVHLAVADHAGGADDPFGHAYPSIERLTTMTGLSRRTVQRCLRSLQDGGWLEEVGFHEWGRGKRTTIWRVTVPSGGVNETGRQPDAAPDSASGGASGRRPNRPLEPSTRSESARDSFPDDLPEDLHDAAIAAGKILKKTALERGQAKAVTRGAVGHAVLTHADRDHVTVAREVENYLLHGKGANESCRDVVQRFRHFLKRSEPRPGPPMQGLRAVPSKRGASPSSVSISDMDRMAEELRERGL